MTKSFAFMLRSLLGTTLLGITLSAAPLPAGAAGDPAAGEQKAQACAGCHGPEGNSPNPEFPKLAGQHPSYLVKQLLDFKEGTTRQSQVMAPMVADLSRQDMQDLAAYYAAQPRQGGYAGEEYVELGREIYRAGNAQSKVPACMSCHGPTGSGNPLAAYPELSGQHAAYTEKQLRDFASGARSNDPNAMMRDITSRMTEEEMKAVAEYVAGLHRTWPAD